MKYLYIDINKLIKCYVEDYSTKYTSFNESCVRALKADI